MPARGTPRRGAFREDRVKMASGVEPLGLGLVFARTTVSPERTALTTAMPAWGSLAIGGRGGAADLVALAAVVLAGAVVWAGVEEAADMIPAGGAGGVLAVSVIVVRNEVFGKWSCCGIGGWGGVRGVGVG